MTKRYLGNIITQNPTAPAGPYEDSAASGVWSLAEAFAYQKAGLWPTAGNATPIGLFFANSQTTIDKFNMATQSDTVDFGDFSSGDMVNSFSVGSTTRAVCERGNSNEATDLEYWAFSTGGNGVDFGDLSVGRYGGKGANNETRGLFIAGYDSSTIGNTIDYITIASTGNAADFGNTSVAKYLLGSSQSDTRATSNGGYSSGFATSNVIDYVTIASTGNAADFGDLTVARYECTGQSNRTRGITAGGGPGPSNVIDYFTIASTGNAVDFGDLQAGRADIGSCASTTQLFMAVIPTVAKEIQVITIATTGNSTDWANITGFNGTKNGTSTSHGGVAA